MITLCNTWIHQLIEDRFSFNKSDRTKLIFFALSSFFIIASYSILRSLKTSVFLGFVGIEYQPYTQFLTIIMIVPCLLAYAKLVDNVKRHQIVYAIFGTFVLLGLIFAACFAHPTIGINNTVTSPYRILGWAFEIYMDLYSALILTTFWGFVNSTSSTEFANKSYGIIVAVSRFGGIGSTLTAFAFFHASTLSHSISIPLIAMLGSFLLLGVIFSVRYIMKHVASENLKSYEQLHQSAATHKRKEKIGLLSGLKIMLQEPYTLGIFGLVYGMEIIQKLLEYQWQVMLSLHTSNHIGNMSSLMFLQTASFQALGFIFAFFGVSQLLKKIGIRSCLFIMPIATIFLSLAVLLAPSIAIIFLVLVVLRAINYGFNHPVREILFIPTTKDIQFKSKSWIESFGKTFAKTSGSALSLFSITQGPLYCLRATSLFSIGISAMYLFVSFFVGKRYVQTIKDNKIIGRDL